MTLLAVAQNEYAIIDHSSKYKGLFTLNLQGCIGIIAHSPITNIKFLAHLDRNSSIAEAASILIQLQNNNKQLNITIIERKNMFDAFENLTLLNIKKYFREQNLKFTIQQTKNGTVAINSNGQVQTNCKIMSLNGVSEKVLLTSELNRFPVYEKLTFSHVFDVQWLITNLNSVVDKEKPLHKAIFDGDVLNVEAELLDLELISIIEKVASQYPERSSVAPEEIKKYIYKELWNKFGVKDFKKNEQVNLDNFQKKFKKVPRNTQEYMDKYEYLKEELDKIKKNIQQQYHSYFVDIAYKFIPQVALLRARHTPLDKDNQPTDSFSFYEPIC